MPLLLINPASGSGMGRHLLKQMLSQGGREVPESLRMVLENKGVSDLSEARVLETDRQGHWKEVLKKFLKGTEGKLILAVGGDGTFRDVAGLLQKSKESILVPIPAGRGNDWMRVLSGFDSGKLDFFAWLKKNKVKWRERKLDLAKLGDIPFLNMASIGYGGHVVRQGESRQAFWSSSRFVYQVEGALALKEYREHRARILCVDGIQGSKGSKARESDRVLWDKPLYGGFVSVGKCNGSGLYWNPNAKFDDGKIDALFFGKPSAFSMTASMLKAKRGGDPVFAFKRVQSRALTIESSVPLPVELDGDYVGEFSRLEFSCNPLAFQVLAPSFYS